jgi:hypothetical protein
MKGDVDMAEPIESLVGRACECDACGCPSTIDAPRHTPWMAAGLPKPVGAHFPWGWAVSQPAGPVVGRDRQWFILRCPRCGARSLPAGTMVEPTVARPG